MKRGPGFWGTLKGMGRTGHLERTESGLWTASPMWGPVLNLEARDQFWNMQA